jgi:integrase
MANRPHLLDVSKIAAASDGVHNDGAALDGCALEIHVRNNGKSKRAYFRYNGSPFGEKRTERIPLASYDLGLPRLRRERVACEQLIEQGKSPKLYRAEEGEKQRLAGMTLREAVAEYFAWGHKVVWKSPHTRSLNDRIRRLYLEPAKIMDLPLDSIRAHHLLTLIEPKWNAQSGNGARMRSLLNGTFQQQIDSEAYAHPNPASWRKSSALSRRLGAQLDSVHHPGPAIEEVPHFVAHLRTRLDGLPGYLTTAEAAYAYDRPVKAIAAATERGRFPGMRKHPKRDWNAAANLIPIPELKAVFGEFVREPVPLPRRDVWLYDRLLQFLFFTPIRAGNACGQLLRADDGVFGGLRWRNIDKDKNLIEYLPRRKDPLSGEVLPSEHKLGWKFNVPYIVILTDNLHAIIEEQRQRQISHGVKIKPDGLVFVHGPSRTGSNIWLGKHLNHRGVEDHLRVAADHLFGLGIIKTNKIVPHGLRTTFVTWAKKHGYSDDLINLSLGHMIPAILENKTNWAYFYQVTLIEERRQMMEHWEQHCLSLCGEPAGNVDPFPHQHRRTNDARFNCDQNGDRATLGLHPANRPDDRPLQRDRL